MALNKRGRFWYGDDQSDIRGEVLRYSTVNGSDGYPAHHFADAVCTCSNKQFRLLLDDNEGVAIRICTACGIEHPIGDSAEFMEEAELEECTCPCDGIQFEITAAVSLYPDSEDVRWLYLGCRCPACGLTAVYGDWKNEFNGYQALLSQI